MMGVRLRRRGTSGWASVSVISDAAPHRVEAAACCSGPHMVRNHSCCTATANCLFAPYLFIYSLVALVSLYRPECNHLSVEYTFLIMTNQNLIVMSLE